MSPTNRDLETESKRVMERVGHCLIIYQRIEVYLKYLLPHVVSHDETPTDTFAGWRSLLDSKSTLGPLVERLRESVRSSDLKGLSHYLSELVEQRNELIHHFSRLPFARLSTREECDAALDHLSTRVRFALSLHEALDGALRQFCDQLVDWKLQSEGQ
jgi:hypothetical protein